MFHEIIIIGAGASGIIAAITAKDMGKDVAILESNNRIGTKILTTGNGRCNITNRNINHYRYHSNNPNFFQKSLDTFTCDDTISFFNSIGLPLVTLEDGKMYPLSLQASSVLDVLRMAVEERNIPVYLNTKVTNISNTNKEFKIVSSDEIYECKKLILCTGGKSSPNTGSDGSGLILSENLGHNIITPVPALVQLKLKCDYLRAISGVKFNGLVQLFIDGESSRKEFGEVLFTDYGISGPPILQVSRLASQGLLKKKTVKIIVDMMPDFESEELVNFLENHWGTFSYRSVYNSFVGLINKKIIPILLKQASIMDIHKPCYELDWKEKKKIYQLLKGWEFTVYDNNSFKNSQVTSGGVNTAEVNNETLESSKIKNLYFAGEILDVDGDCGGFNLQWAWSSGFIAGKSAAEK